MAEYTINSGIQESETTFLAYRQERGGVQSVAGQMYQAIQRTEEAYAAFEALLQPGQPFESLAEYHAALQAPVNQAVNLLRSKMAEILALMRAMETAMPSETILFPGVPRNEAE